MFPKRKRFSLKFYLSIAGFSTWGILWVFSVVEVTNISSSRILLSQRQSVSDNIAENVSANVWSSRNIVPDEIVKEINENDTVLHTIYEESYASSFGDSDNDNDTVINLNDYIQKTENNAYNDVINLLNEMKTRKHISIDCLGLMEGAEVAVMSARHYMKYNQRKAVSLKTYTWMLDCASFKRQRGYFQYIPSDSERDFPLAFAIVVYRDVEQVERLLRAIYRPHNYYCLHIDIKTKSSDFDALNSIVSCFDNVFIVQNPVNVTWGEFSVLEAELLCMKLLWGFKTWKYYINLTGQEFPLKTNLELVKILKAMKGANVVDGSSISVSNKDFFRWTQAGSRPPHNIKLIKGSVHVAVNRDFVDFCLHDQRSRDFQEWLKKTQIPDETFFASLNHNPHLGIAGSYLGGTKESPSKPLFMRYKKWQNDVTDDGIVCRGKYVRGICVIGIGDLPQVANHAGLFVNKLYIEYEYLALDCLEELLLERTLDQYINRRKIAVSFYENIDQVKYRLKRRENG